MIVGGLLGESVGVSTKLEPRREARFPLCKVVARFEAPPLHQFHGKEDREGVGLGTLVKRRGQF